MGRFAARGSAACGTRASQVSARHAAGRGAAYRNDATVPGHHPLPEHDYSRERREVARQPRARAQDPLGDPLERGGDHPPRKQGVFRARRPHRELPVFGAALRHRLRAFLACADGPTRRRPDLRAGSRFARHLCARVRRRTPDRAAAPRLPPGERRQGHSFVSASVADAGFLAVPDGVDGSRTVDGDLSGALPQVSGRSRHGQDRQPQGVGIPRRRRVRRAGIARRDLARRAREARQPDLRHQLQPAAARRAGARQRQDHPGARRRIPRRRLERDQGGLGLRLGQAVREGQGKACC